VSSLVYGIGDNTGKYPAMTQGKRCKEYLCWKAMLYRCTKEYWGKFPTYEGTTCSENFKNYSFFYEWYKEQRNSTNTEENGRKWHLDKDLLTNGGKHYSEHTCVFVPHRINTLMVKCNASRGDLPIGVCFNKQRKNYKAQCNVAGKLKYLGVFSSKEKAFQAYKTFKESLIKQVANEYKEQLDYRAYEALMEYEVNITD